MTACGTDYLNKDWFSRSYILVYSFFVYYMPLFMIIYSYYFIIAAVSAHERSMREQAKKMNVASLRSSESANTSAECKLAKVRIWKRVKKAKQHLFWTLIGNWGTFQTPQPRSPWWPSPSGSWPGLHTWSSTMPESSKPQRSALSSQSGVPSSPRQTPYTIQLFMASGDSQKLSNFSWTPTILHLGLRDPDHCLIKIPWRF